MATIYELRTDYVDNMTTVTLQMKKGNMFYIVTDLRTCKADDPDEPRALNIPISAEVRKEIIAGSVYCWNTRYQELDIMALSLRKASLELLELICACWKEIRRLEPQLFTPNTKPIVSI